MDFKTYLSLFATGFVQVFFVAINTVFIAKHNAAGVFIASLLISLVWSFNVKRVAFGTHYDRGIYALGAAIGSVSGLKFSSYFLTFL